MGSYHYSFGRDAPISSSRYSSGSSYGGGIRSSYSPTVLPPRYSAFSVAVRPSSYSVMTTPHRLLARVPFKAPALLIRVRKYPGLGKGRTYQRSIPAIAHQRLSPVSAPPSSMRPMSYPEESSYPMFRPYRMVPSTYVEDVFAPALEDLEYDAHEWRVQASSLAHRYGFPAVHAAPEPRRRMRVVYEDDPYYPPVSRYPCSYTDSEIFPTPIRDTQRNVLSKSHYRDAGTKSFIEKRFMPVYGAEKSLESRRAPARSSYDDSRTQSNISFLSHYRRMPRRSTTERGIDFSTKTSRMARRNSARERMNEKIAAKAPERLLADRMAKKLEEAAQKTTESETAEAVAPAVATGDEAPAAEEAPEEPVKEVKKKKKKKKVVEVEEEAADGEAAEPAEPVEPAEYAEPAAESNESYEAAAEPAAEYAEEPAAEPFDEPAAEPVEEPVVESSEVVEEAAETVVAEEPQPEAEPAVPEETAVEPLEPEPVEPTEPIVTEPEPEPQPQPEPEPEVSIPAEPEQPEPSPVQVESVDEPVVVEAVEVEAVAVEPEVEAPAEADTEFDEIYRAQESLESAADEDVVNGCGCGNESEPAEPADWQPSTEEEEAARGEDVEPAAQLESVDVEAASELNVATNEDVDTEFNWDDVTANEDAPRRRTAPEEVQQESVNHQTVAAEEAEEEEEDEEEEEEEDEDDDDEEEEE